MTSLTHLIKTPQTIKVEDLLVGLTPKEQALVRDAYAWVCEVYGDRVMPMGELVLSHTVGVARQATALNMGVSARLAGLLSRLPSIMPAAHEEVAVRFGASTRRLIEGLEKLRRLDQTLQAHKPDGDDKNSAAQAEILRKMLLVLADDMRMVVLKLIGRIQTLHYIYKNPTDSAREVAFATLHFLAPLANRLGLYDLKWPLEDWSFRILEPEAYQHIAQSLRSRRQAREQLVHDFLAALQTLMQSLGLKGEIKGRAKHLYSIHRKMQRKAINVSGLYDLHATRILVEDVESCYRVLGALHGKWPFVQQEFDDYIARPKENGYQSLHTVVMFNHEAVEVQIRTKAMHDQAESGLASHWRYKEGIADDAPFEERLHLLRELMDWQKDVAEEDHRLQLLTEDTIYCLTPKGQVFDLPFGATPLDFAYRVHTELGHRCRGAKVDGVLMPLSTPLKSGQCIDIISAKEGGPSRDWLLERSPFLKSHRARAKVRQWFNLHEHEARINEGRSSWLRIQSRLRPVGKAAPSGEEVSAALGFGNLNDFYLAMSRGVVGMHQLQALVRGYDASQPLTPLLPASPSNIKAKKVPLNKTISDEEGYSGKVSILDMGDMAYQKAACCKPTPPQAIIGYITRNNVVSVHCANCHELWQISNRMPERVIAVAWKREAAIAHRKASARTAANIKPHATQWQVQGAANLAADAPPFLAEVMGTLQQGGHVIASMHFEQAQQASVNTPTLTFTLTQPPADHASFCAMLESLPSVAKAHAE